MSEQEMIKDMLQLDLTPMNDPNFGRRVLQEYRRRKVDPKSPFSIVDERILVIALVAAAPIAIFSSGSPDYTLPVVLLTLTCIPLILIGLDLTHRRLSRPTPTNP